MKGKVKVLIGLCTAIACVGWFLILGGCFWLVAYFTRANSAVTNGLGEIEFYLQGISAVSFDFFFIGLGAVILARFVKFVVEKESKPTLMLRCGSKIFYAFALLVIAWAIFRNFMYAAIIENAETRFLFQQPALLPSLGKVIVLVLLGQILKRLLPVIQEYKTLV